MLLLLKSSFNSLVFGLSAAALGTVIAFVADTENLVLDSAPKALVNLQETIYVYMIQIFLPPLINLQVFIFCFDSLVCVYYLYQLPCWDRLKQRFVYYQYEAQPVEKQDCSNLFLQTLFIILSKGLALGILIAMQLMANTEINRVYNEYMFSSNNTQEDLATLAMMQSQAKQAMTGAVLDGILAGITL